MPPLGGSQSDTPAAIAIAKLRTCAEKLKWEAGDPACSEIALGRYYGACLVVNGAYGGPVDRGI